MAAAFKPISGPIPVTVDRIGELFGVTSKAVRDWIRDGLPVLKQGGKGRGNGAILDLAQCLKWHMAESGELDAEQQRARRDKEMADKIAMENALRRGEIADVNDIGQMMSEANGIVRSRLLAMPSKLAPLLVSIPDPPKISGIIKAEVYQALNELADPKNIGALRMALETRIAGDKFDG